MKVPQLLFYNCYKKKKKVNDRLFSLMYSCLNTTPTPYESKAKRLGDRGIPISQWRGEDSSKQAFNNDKQFLHSATYNEV